MSGSKRIRPAVVGVGTTTYGVLPDHDADSLGLWAMREALADCGLTVADIDGLFLHRITDYQKFVRVTGMKPRVATALPPQGRMMGVSLQMAASAIMSGAADVVAVVYGNDGRSAGARYGGKEDRYATGAEQLWFPYGMTSPGAVHALMFQRYMREFGARPEQLGAISMAFRHHASLNPHAVMRKPITLEDYLNAPFICEPLRRLDYCLINDGGVAMILTSPERARDLKQKPVYMRGYAMSSRLAEGEVSPDYGRSNMQRVASRVFPMADVKREDVDALMIYDNFTPTVLFALEGFGFCKVGEGGPFVENGRLELGGALPINTSGGHLSESYMQGWNLNTEAVRQLRGECGERQVRDARNIQYIGAGPVSTSIIYSSEPHP